MKKTVCKYQQNSMHIPRNSHRSNIRIDPRANTFKHFYKRLLLHIKSTNTHNYSDDTTLSTHDNAIVDVTISLKNGAKEAISWFTSNNMSVCR